MGWELTEIAWTQDSRMQDCVVTRPRRGTPKPFNATIEIYSHNGRKQARQISALGDTGQNVREGVIISKALCTKLGLASEILPNTGIPLGCANPGTKLKVAGRLARGAFRLKFLFGPEFLVDPLVVESIGHPVNIGLAFLE